MNLVELTVVLAIGLAMVSAGLIQGNNQYEVVRTYKQVGYYSNDVPRMITGVQNVTRGAKSFYLVPNSNSSMGSDGPIVGGTGWASQVSAGATDHSQAMVIIGEEKHSDGSGGTTTSKFSTRLFLVERTDITPFGSDRYEDQTGAMDLRENKYHLAVKSINQRAGVGLAYLNQPGWYILRNVADVRFDHVPGSDGVILMRVFRQYKSGEAPQLAFEQVLERR